jgi:hypothetical protein
MTRTEQLADAMLAIAKTNHYMVGLVESVTLAEKQGAEQLLITGQNRHRTHTSTWRHYDLALDLLENTHAS